jgi:hypothetical protein
MASSIIVSAYNKNMKSPSTEGKYYNTAMLLPSARYSPVKPKGKIFTTTRRIVNQLAKILPYSIPIVNGPVLTSVRYALV